jgi:hypothetical protein
VSVTDDARGEISEIAASARERTGVEISDDELLESPHIFIGSIDELAEKLVRLRDQLGISSFMVGEMGPLDPLVERLAGS